MTANGENSVAIDTRPTDRADQIRAIACATDPTGFQWLIEQRMSRSTLQAMPSDPDEA
jgi:hypothetical protein